MSGPITDYLAITLNECIEVREELMETISNLDQVISLKDTEIMRLREMNAELLGALKAILSRRNVETIELARSVKEKAEKLKEMYDPR